MAPHGDIVEAELIPPEVQHGLFKTKDAVAGDAIGRRHKLFQAIVDASALIVVDAG